VELIHTRTKKTATYKYSEQLQGN